MVYHMGGFPTIRHNEIRDLTASQLTEVCPNVAIEPHLSRETFRLASANTDDGARVDVRARGFWNACQDGFFHVRVFHPNAPSNSSRSLSAAYKKDEDEKKRYGQLAIASYTRNRAWHLHPTCTFNIRRHGKRSTNLLQMLG